MKFTCLKIIITLFFITSFTANSQVVINELMSSNTSTITDEDGDYSDWIEIFNAQDTSVNLSGYGISDDSSDLYKWVMHDINIPAKDHLLIFASDKNRTTSVKQWETIITQGDGWKYFLGTSEPPDDWNEINFDDQSWQEGPSGFGFGDNDDATTVPNVQSVYIRKIFTVDDINNISAAILHVDYDDAFVAYLNGVEISRSNIGTLNVPPPYNQSANEASEAVIYTGGRPGAFPVDDFQNILLEGENVLAIQVHNYGTSSTDLTLIPFFSLGMNSIPSDANGPDPLLDFPFRYLHTNFKLSSDGEDIFITDPQENIVDSISTGEMFPDISLGRQPDGESSWFFFNEPTPGESNTTSGYTGVASEPEFSLAGGLYTGSIEVSLSGTSGNDNIYYTLDGSEPTEASPVYSQPIQITSTEVVRARNLPQGFIHGRTVTNTYIISFSSVLPVFSISTNPENFFDEDSGIYMLGNNYSPDYPYFGANFWQDWERPVHVELFDTNNSGFSIDAGVKIFGGWSRAMPQKSLSIFAREDYGFPEIKYSLFPDLPITEYESFVLRNSGNDWESTMFRDGLMTTLVDGVDIDKQDYRPAVVFINGDYWGIQNIREKVNEDFISAHHNIDRDSIDMLENFGTIVSGDNTEYMELYNFIRDNDLSVSSNYEYVKSKIDINNFIAYHLSQIYFDNEDWPGNNIKYWKPKTNGKWRWIMFDTDFGFSLYDDGYAYNTLAFALADNGPDWPNPPWSTLFLRKLLADQSFKNDFINCASDLLNTNFLSSTVVQKINSMKDNISSEMPRHISRWNPPYNFTGWESNVSRMITFANQRPGYLRQHINQQFGLTGTLAVNVTIPDTSMGFVKLNSIEINVPAWTGSYFKNIPVTLIARPKPGYKFANWQGSNSTDEDTISIASASTINITALFEIDPAFSIPKIVINEINYNPSPSFDTEDWVELYNNSDTSVNISGWVFKDSEDNHAFTIPEGTVLGGGKYIVLCTDTSLFTPLFPDVHNYTGSLDFGLSGSSELIRLFDADSTIIDSLTYSDTAPWPTEADGNGATLSLKNPDLDNTLGESWAASIEHGTPGELNDFVVGIDDKTNSLPTKYALYQNYPNPFNPVTSIKYSIIKASDVSVKVYDILGNEVKILVDEFQQPGYYNVTLSAEELSSGVYFYRIITDNFISTKKLILLK